MRLSPLLLAAFLFAPLSPPDAAYASPSGADTTGVGVRSSGGFILSLRPVWSRTAGFGIGVGYKVAPLPLVGGQLRLMARPNQHMGRYAATYFTSDPYRSPFYGAVNVFYETVGRQWYYGVGPGTAEASVVAVEREQREVEVRLGATFLEHRLFVQPLVRYARHEVDGFRPWRGSFEALDTRSRRNLLFAAGDTASGVVGASAVQEGFWYGLAAGLDTRDARARPTRGVLVQASAQRYTPQGGSDVRLDRFYESVHAFVPLGRLVPFGPGGQTLGLRVVAEHARNRGDVPIPFYLMPSLDGRHQPGLAQDRYFGNDLLAVSLEYRLPVFAAFGLVGMDGLVSVHLGGVYDDLFAQFDPAVSFEAPALPGGTVGAPSYALRPSLGLGARIVSLYADSVFLEGTLGLSAEGLATAGFGFVLDMRELAWYKQ